jgi:hypothetical protein
MTLADVGCWQIGLKMARRTKLFRTADARARRREGPRRFIQNRPRTFVAALQGVAAWRCLLSRVERTCRSAGPPPSVLAILWCGLAHVQADRSSGARLLLRLADVRALLPGAVVQEICSSPMIDFIN